MGLTKKIWWDAGHGGTDPGANANGLKEKDLTLAIVKHAMAYLAENYTGFEQKATRLTDTTVELGVRDDPADAWGADVFVSVHINAGGGNGYESFIYNALSATNKSKAIALQNVMDSEIMAAMRQFGEVKTHGDVSKEANFSVLRETDMTALLTENLFIDTSDSKYLKNPAFIKAVGEAHARGVAKFLGLRRKPVPAGEVTSFPEAREFAKEFGISDGSRPKDPVKREEVWEMLLRAKNKGVFK